MDKGLRRSRMIVGRSPTFVEAEFSISPDIFGAMLTSTQQSHGSPRVGNSFESISKDVDVQEGNITDLPDYISC